MNIQKLANEIIKAQYTQQFTKVVPIKLKPEGATRFSLENAKIIADARYQLTSDAPMMTYDKNKAVYKLKAHFKRGNDTFAEHTFLGFSFGYGGEGPHGLMEFGRLFNFDLDQSKVLGNVAGFGESGMSSLDDFR